MGSVEKQQDSDCNFKFSSHDHSHNKLQQPQNSQASFAVTKALESVSRASVLCQDTTWRM